MLKLGNSPSARGAGAVLNFLVIVCRTTSLIQLVRHLENKPSIELAHTRGILLLSQILVDGQAPVWLK